MSDLLPNKQPTSNEPKSGKESGECFELEGIESLSGFKKIVTVLSCSWQDSNP
jgi:hypothetical protein